MENLDNMKAWQDAVSVSKDCLSTEELHALLDNGSEESALHVKGCSHCRAELAMIRSFESSGSPDETEVTRVVARLRAQSGIATRRLPQAAGWRAFLRLPYLAGAAAAVLVVALGISLYVNRPQHPALSGDISGSQTWRSASVHVTAPSGELAQAPDSFHWERFPGAKSYAVELLEVDGSVVWTGNSQAEVLPVGPEMKAKLQPGKPLAWRVTARDSSGKAIASSNTEHFIVKPANRRK